MISDGHERLYSCTQLVTAHRAHQYKHHLPPKVGAIMLPSSVPSCGINHSSKCVHTSDKLGRSSDIAPVGTCRISFLLYMAIVTYVELHISSWRSGQSPKCHEAIAFVTEEVMNRNYNDKNTRKNYNTKNAPRDR